MKKSELYATIGTIVISGILIAILMLCGLSIHKEQMDEGLMVSFGDEISGYGDPTPQTPVVASVAPVSVPKTVVQDNLMTQDEPSVALEQEKKRKKEEEQKRIQEQIELKRKQAQQEAEQRKQAEQTAKASNAAKVFGQGSSTGSGDGEGNAIQGNPAGKGNSGGHSWSLEGRDLRGKLAQPPYDKDVEGRVVITIRVDKQGNVTDATVKTRGTTIMDERLRNVCKEAARKAKFTPGSDVSVGEITYRFLLN